MEKVIVTTEFRGVFFGSLESREGREVVLHDARFVMRWGTEHGVAQLAATGPTRSSVLGSVAPKIWLCSVTAVMTCTAAAAEEWDRHAAG